MSDELTACVVPSRRRFLKSIVLAAGTVAAGSLLQACGQQAAPAPTAAPKPDAKPAEAKPTAAAQPATQAPAAAKPASAQAVKLGVVLPYSKVYAQLGESITNGMEMYFDSVSGTAGGRKIELIKEDEEVDPQIGLRKARKLVEQDNVDLMTGVVSTATVYAIRDFVDQSKTLFLASNAGGNDLTRARKSPYIFRTSFSNAQPSVPMGDYVYANVAKRVVICAADYGAGRESTAAFKAGFERAGGQVLAEVWPPFPNTDYAPFLGQIQQAAPEAVYSFFSGSDAVNYIKQFDEFGLKGSIKLTGSGFMLENDVFEAQGLAGVGGITGLHWAYTLDNPENKKFVEEYTAKFKRDPDVFAVQGFDTGRTIVEALNKAQGNTADKDALIKVLEQTSFASPRGPFKIDPETHNPIHNIYARETRETNGKPQNYVIATFPDVKDPGS
jgi:branched-chain amino acid transport system substrate-binding protein